MRPKHDLHELIRSMSMSEKRHFRILASRHIVGEKNNYMHLFDAMAGQENYNEEAIKKEFAGTNFIRHLPSEKNYLYQLLLESLNAYHREKTFLSQHTSFIASIELLFQRGLYAQCRTLIYRAKKEAYSLEKFSILLIILRWEILLHIKDEDDKNLNRAIGEELRILEVMRIQTTLMQIAFNIQIAIDKGNTGKTFIREAEADLRKNLPAHSQITSFWTKYYFHSGIGLLSSLKKEQSKRIESFMAVKNIMDDAPQFIRDLPGIYHTNMNNIVNVFFLLGKFSEAEKIIQQQKQFLSQNRIRNLSLSRIVFVNTAESELFFFYKTNRIREGMNHARRTETEIRKLDLHFSPLLYDLFFMLAVIDFCGRNFKSCGKWLNKILNMEREIHLRKELSINTRLLYLLLLFETHDILFDARLRSAKRYLQQERQFSTHMKILEVIRLLSEGSISKKRRALLRKYVAEIRTETKTAQHEALNKQFDFASWIDEKIKVAVWE